MKRWIAKLMLIALVVGMIQPFGLTQAVDAASMKLNKKSVTITVGKKVTLKVKKAKGKVTWRSSKKKVATVSKKGVVKGKKPGSAKITAKVKNKKFTCKVKVKAAKKKVTTTQNTTTNTPVTPVVTPVPVAVATPVPNISISFTGDQIQKLVAAEDGSSYESLSTDEEEVTIAGTVTCTNTTLKSLSYSLAGTSQNLSGELTPADTFRVQTKLEAGTSVLTITATDTKGNVSKKDLMIVRYTKTLSLNSDMMVADEDAQADFDAKVADLTTETVSTPGELDKEQYHLFIEKDSILGQKVEDGELPAGKTYYVPATDEWPMGFTGSYVEYQDSTNSKYDGQTYYEIVFDVPAMTDVLGDSGCIQLSGIDKENPVAFTSFDDTSFQTKTATNKYTRKVFPEGIKPSLEVSGDTGSISLGFSDAVLFDADADSETKDQVKLSGEIKLSDMTLDSNLEWSSLAPDQIRADQSYTQTQNLKLSMDTKVDFSDFVKDVNNDFTGKCNYFGMELSGVDTSDKIMLGVIGLNLAVSPTVVKGNNLGDLSKLRQPMLFVAIFIDMSGNVSAKGSVTFESSAYYEMGTNLYKTNSNNVKHTGVSSYDTKKEYGKYTLATYNHKRKSKNEYSDPSPSVTLEGSLKAEVTSGVGVMAGLLISGIVPADCYGELYGKMSVEANGTIKITKDTSAKTVTNKSLVVEGTCECGAKLGVDAKFAVSNIPLWFLDEVDVSYSNSAEFKFFELKLLIPQYKMSGEVIDKISAIKKENIHLGDAKFYYYQKDRFDEDTEFTYGMLKRNKADFEGKSITDGKYEVEGMGRKTYILLVEKEGYDPYIEELDFSADKNEDIYMTPLREKNWLDVCKPYEYTLTHGEYIGDGLGSMTISGVEYDTGFYLNDSSAGVSGSSEARFNLGGKYSALKVRIGHLENTQPLNGELKIFLDGAEEPSQTITLDSTAGSKVYTINLDYAQSAIFAVDKTQTNNWSTTSYGFVEGVWYGENGAEGTIHTKTPYDGLDLSTQIAIAPFYGYAYALLSDTSTVKASGNEYSSGFTLSSVSVASYGKIPFATINTAGKFSALRVTIGHVDGTLSKNPTLKVYLNGSDTPSQTISLSASAVAKYYQIPLYYADCVKFEMSNEHDNWSTTKYVFADIKYTL